MAVEVAGELALQRVAQLYETLLPHLDERQRRLVLGGGGALGWGAAGVEAGGPGVGGSRARPCRRGPAALEAGEAPACAGAASAERRAAAASRWPRPTRSLGRGAGWRWWSRRSRGDPMIAACGGRTWSTRNLADELTAAWATRCSAPTAWPGC